MEGSAVGCKDRSRVDDEQRAVREHLIGQGIPAELLDGIELDDWFPPVASHRIWDGPPTLTAQHMGSRVGLDPEVVRRLWMRFGFVDPGSRPTFREQDVAAFALAAAGISFFNEDAAERFCMVVGLAMRRITEAALAMAIHRNDYVPANSVAEEFDLQAITITLFGSVADDL